MTGKHLVMAKSDFNEIIERRKFGCKREEVTGRRGKLHSDELQEPHCTQNIIKVIKIRNGMGGECGTHEERNMHTGFWWGSLMERDYLAGLRVHVTIILKCILQQALTDGVQ